MCEFCLLVISDNLILFFIFFNVYLLLFFFERERQTQNVSGLRSEREEDTESEAGSSPWAVSTEPDVGLELTNRETVTWAEVGRSTNWATQAPLKPTDF